MKKTLKSIQKKHGMLNEAYAWERQEGKSLPTLADVQAKYNAKSVNEQQNMTPPEQSGEGTLRKKDYRFLDYLEGLGGVRRVGEKTVLFAGPDGKEWFVSLELVWNEKNVEDAPRWVDPSNNGVMGREFEEVFTNRKSL